MTGVVSRTVLVSFLKG